MGITCCCSLPVSTRQRPPSDKAIRCNRRHTLAVLGVPALLLPAQSGAAQPDIEKRKDTSTAARTLEQAYDNYSGVFTS